MNVPPSPTSHIWPSPEEACPPGAWLRPRPAVTSPYVASSTWRRCWPSPGIWPPAKEAAPVRSSKLVCASRPTEIRSWTFSENDLLPSWAMSQTTAFTVSSRSAWRIRWVHLAEVGGWRPVEGHRCAWSSTHLNPKPRYVLPDLVLRGVYL